jgi:hypothetical protein
MKSMVRRIAARLPSPLKSSLVTFYSCLLRLLIELARPYYMMTRMMRRRVLGQWAAAKSSAVLFLAPEAGLTPFFGAHALLVRTLQESGHVPIVLSCDGILPICSYKMSLGTGPTEPSDKANLACRKCRWSALVEGHRHGLVDVSINSLLDAADIVAIRTVIEKNPGAPWGTIYDGIAFGDLAMGETLRDRRKLDQSELSADDRSLLHALIFSSLAIHFAVKKLMTRYTIRRIVFYGDYIFWLPISSFVGQVGVPSTHIRHGYNLDIDLRLLELRNHTAHEEQSVQITDWYKHRDAPITPETVEKIAESSLYRLIGHGGVSTHSPNWIRRDTPLQDSLGLSQSRRTLVAYSSSSDEFLGAQHIMRSLGLEFGHLPTPFSDNQGWLRALVDWVDGRDDMQLVIRAHPRLAGIRGRPISTEYYKLKKEFSLLPSNVRMIWPEDRVSSYNLAEIADAVLVAWSTLGLELARFGIPVVSAFLDIGPFPTGSFIAFESSPQRYFAAVKAAARAPAMLDAIIEAFRWTHYLFLSPTVDVSDVIPSFDYDGMPVRRTPRNRDLILRALIDNEDISAINVSQLKRGAGPERMELDAIVQAIERFIFFFITGEDRRGGSLQDLRVEADHVLALKHGGRIIRRYSPLAHRLALMISQKAARHALTSIR